MSKTTDIIYIKNLTILIDQSLSWRNHPETYDKTVERITELANCVADYDGETEDWIYPNEFGMTPSDIIIGAHWHSSQWHAGQSGPVYAMGCATGRVFSPGMESGPEPGSSEENVFTLLALKTGKVKECEMEDGSFELVWIESGEPLDVE